MSWLILLSRYTIMMNPMYLFKYKSMKVEKVNTRLTGYAEFFITVKFLNVTIATVVETFQIYAGQSMCRRHFKRVFSCVPKSGITVGGWDILKDESALPILGKHPIVGCIRYTSIRSLVSKHPTFLVGIEDVSDISVSGHGLLVIGYGYDYGVLYFIVHWGFVAYMKFRPNVFHQFCSFDIVRWMEKKLIAIQKDI
ncbi:hypothetical protein H5410_060779 [Solanum commersonii]|uniref:Uncharacterized protein n=1 Tax=Solanum commersonii TaxID=4109 RepID=A0A9J5W5Z4_SOLCO|nr:hypothetical protein H5410_060779 [Solanum commersonii]